MKFLLLALSFFGSHLWADGLFDRFQGEYEIHSRWCETGDTKCAELVKLQEGYDEAEMKSFVVETYKDGSTRKIVLWTGSNGKEEAFTTGDSGLSASWSYRGEFENHVTVLQSVDLYRNGTTAPLYYKFTEDRLGEESPTKVQRRFRLAR